MMSEQPTSANQARSTSGATRRGRGATSSSARYGYRRFRNTAPKPQQQPPNSKSAVIEGNVDQGCLDDSLVEPASGQNPNGEGEVADFLLINIFIQIMCCLNINSLPHR